MNNEENKKPQGEEEDIDFIDILSMPISKALSELVKIGAKAIKSLKEGLSKTFQKIADEEYKKICRPELTMNDCISWLKIQRQNYPQAAYFFITIEQNPEPRNENDMFSVILAITDDNKQPIPVENAKKKSKSEDQDIVCVVVPARTLDAKLLKALNGGSSVLVKL